MKRRRARSPFDAYIGRGLLAFGLSWGFSCGVGEIEDMETDIPDLAPVASGGDATASSATTSMSTSGDTLTTSQPTTGNAVTGAPMDSSAGPTGGDGSGTGSCASPTLLGYADGDDDGFGDAALPFRGCALPSGYVDNGDDCDDDDPAVHPGATELCAGGVDLNCDDELPARCASCMELKASGNGETSGLYTIDIDGPEGPRAPVQVYCDQETLSGGWTLVQRTVWDPAQTQALQTNYVQWRTQSVGSPAPGDAYRLPGELWDDLQQQLDHLLQVDLRVGASGASCQPLYYRGTGGVLAVSEAGTSLTGLVADAQIVSSTELSATDLGPSTNCVNDSNAVPWFFGACCSTCPRYQGAYWNEPHPMLSYASSVADMFGNVEADVCDAPAAAAINGSVYRGANAMAYYVR